MHNADTQRQMAELKIQRFEFKVDAFRHEFRADLAEFKHQVHVDTTALRDELRAEMRAGDAMLRKEMTDGLGSLRGEMQAGDALLRKEMTGLATELGSLREEMRVGFATTGAKLEKSQRVMLTWWVSMMIAMVGLILSRT